MESDRGARDRPPGARVPLARKVAFLSGPQAYPEPARTVEVRETHMAWVFLTERHAWKMKKPVLGRLLDFRTLEARRADCEEEVRLNRRLAPAVYLGVVPLALEGGRELHLGGGGEPVEWLVCMRRLPDEGMLERAIGRGRLERAALDGAAQLLADFYARAERVPKGGFEHRRELEETVEESRRELSEPDRRMPPRTVSRIAGAQLDFLRREAALFDRRAEEGRIVEGHGDLRPEHVCLGPEPAVIDCLEFHRELRVLDAVSDLAFLALECERLGAGWVGAHFLEVYGRRCADRPDPPLIDFYESLHACVRARIALWHLDEPEVDGAERWRRKALHYLRLAGRIEAAAGA